MSLLEVKGIDVYYGEVQVLYDIALHVEENEAVSIVGANSAGKSTLIKTISGLNGIAAGSIEFGGRRIDGLPPHEIVECGVVQIPEGRRVFPFMTVEENLMMGAYNSRAVSQMDKTMAEVLDLFPKLDERRRQLARTLSGGEQQMLAIARGLMAKPRCLCSTNRPWAWRRFW